MKYRTLGMTKLKVSIVGIGTYQYGGEWGRPFSQIEVNDIISRGYELGVNLIDTAECYGDHLSESLIGKAIHGNRQDWIVATKFGHKFLSYQTREQAWTAKSVKEQLELSLKALKTDYIDIYQFHSGNNETFNNEELWLMLQKEVSAGRIRYLGISLSKRSHINILEQCNKAIQVGASVIQINYNRLDREAEQIIFPSCIRQNLGVIARVPLASGLLSGKYQPGVRFPENDHRASESQDVLDEKLTIIEKIKTTEKPVGLEMPEWAIAWCLQHEAISCCIPGFKNVKQLETGVGSADLNLVSLDHRLAWK